MRNWCVAWDGSPFVIRIESRHLTQRTARLRLARWRVHSQTERYFVSTVAEADRLDAAVRRDLLEFHLLPDNRFEISGERAS